VVIYSGAIILGGKTVIGRGAIIGGNVWITESVPPDTRVLLAPHDAVETRGPKKNAGPSRNTKARKKEN